MEQERWQGTASYTREGAAYWGASYGGTIIIQRIQSRFNLVTIEGLGQGKVVFNQDGTFQGTWALGDRIYDVEGQATGNQHQWEGTFQIHRMDGRMFVNGSFQANRELAKTS